MPSPGLAAASSFWVICVGACLQAISLVESPASRLLHGLNRAQPFGVSAIGGASCSFTHASYSFRGMKRREAELMQ